jgi:hypothetical protein
VHVRGTTVLSLFVCGAAGCNLSEPLSPAVFLTPTAVTLEDGQSMQIEARLRSAKTRAVRWSSSNPEVATVDVRGLVTAVTNGQATIVAKMVDDSTRTASVAVTVTGPPVASVTVSPASATVYVGFTLRAFAQLRAADGRVIRGRPMTWTSADIAIADVAGQGTQGVLRGRAAGGPLSILASSEGRSGAIQVRVAYAAYFCPFVTALALGEAGGGRLSLGDCEFPLDGSYVDVFRFTLPAAATVQVDMVSRELDSYLGIFTAEGDFLAQDDDSGGAKDARIITSLAAGTYLIWANTTAGGSSGTYTLTLTQK